MAKIIAVMPIKLVNERLPGKNTMMLGDKPLLRHELDLLLQIEELDDIYVYCSDSTVCSFLPLGVKYMERPAFLDLPDSNFTQIFENFITKVDADIYVYAHATAPYVSLETMHQCIDAVMSGEYDSAFCAEEIRDYLWKDGKPLNFEATNIPRSQDLEPIYRETSGVYVFKKDVFLKQRRRIGEKPYIKKVDYRESVDINTYEDFLLAEKLL